MGDLERETNLLRRLFVKACGVAGSESNLRDLTGIVDRDRFISRGGYGEVYRGKWTKGTAEERRYPNIAVKVLPCPEPIDGEVAAEELKVCHLFG
jgi:hypothetical protein